MPDAFGLSHNAQGEGDEKDGIFVVSKIVEVRHVDVVADPATTKSLSESIKKEPAMEPEKKMEADMAPEPKKTMEADNAEFGAKAAEIIGGEGDTSSKVKALVELVHAMYGAESDKTAVDEEEAAPSEDPSEEVEKRLWNQTATMPMPKRKTRKATRSPWKAGHTSQSLFMRLASR